MLFKTSSDTFVNWCHVHIHTDAKPYTLFTLFYITWAIHATCAEVAQCKCVVHMWHLSQGIICVSYWMRHSVWHDGVKQFHCSLYDKVSNIDVVFYIRLRHTLINCDLSTFNLHVCVRFSVTWVCTSIYGSAVKFLKVLVVRYFLLWSNILCIHVFIMC